MIVPITVLMSVYNGERWLRESIESVLGQTFTDFEFIIVNDGSRDSTLDIINGFAARDRRIQVINKPNTGLADSLNVGIGQARGEWIARLDADDLCEPNRLSVQYALASSKKEFVLIGSGLTGIDESSQPTKFYKYPPYHQDLVNRLITKKGFFAHSSAFVRTKTIKAVGGYRTRIKRAEDYDLWLRLSEVGELGCVDESLVRIRHHVDQISHDEGGRRQKIDSRVALVSYLLRQRGLADPVAAESTDSEFAKFWQFVERGVALDQLVGFRRFISELKARRDTATLAGLFSALAFSVGSPHFVLRYFREAFLGEKLAMRLADEWIRKITTCAE
ncbi:glycosyltransferase [Candidatus Symbiobacter mobilis]|uniref:Cell wall biogenesis glycosyltransferase n=1 Tax=Candidatus Symbiobacter mobilis CR TaxID=946483 RepID=U5N523_9BURK|nr:glycosyltransferase [Candidatus Symbiobacter mobilis]AGX86621.1 cell wall biogenesis glycosyltransferase [Candidatus Symbiobacter mobilis CR]